MVSLVTNVFMLTSQSLRHPTVLMSIFPHGNHIMHIIETPVASPYNHVGAWCTCKAHMKIIAILQDIHLVTITNPVKLLGCN